LGFSLVAAQILTIAAKEKRDLSVEN